MPDPEVDLSKFKRTTLGGLAAAAYGRFSLSMEVHAIAQLGYGMDPRVVPVHALRLMNTHPAVYFARRTITGIIRRPDLFSVKHEDPRIVAEVEAWLWPLLGRLLSGAAAGFDYGSAACVLDWERSDLRFAVPSSTDPTAKRAKTIARHTHFAKAHELNPEECSFLLDEQGEIIGLQTALGAFGADRVAPWIWDAEFGEVVGQGAKRRAWRAYCEYLILSVLRDKYLERSVDAPRIVFAPEGKVTVDGEEWDIPAYAAFLSDELRGSGSAGFPSITDDKGVRKYAVEPLVLPDRHQVWEESLNRCEADIFVAYLVAPTMSGGLDDVGGAASKTIDGLLREHIEDLANYVAAGLTRIVGIVHRANYGDDGAAPEIVPTDVGKAAARKIMQEVLRLANASARGEVALRTDIPALLDKLGIPLRDPPLDPFAQPDPSAQETGRPEQATSDREDRREDAETVEGEEDTGDPEESDGEEREEQTE